MPKTQSWLNSGGRQPSSVQPSSSSGLCRKQKLAQTAAITVQQTLLSDPGWHSGGFCQRQIVREAAPSLGHPRPFRRSGRTGRPGRAGLEFDRDACGMNEDEMSEPIGLRRLRRPGAGRYA